jgi:hypothetical protein
MEMCGHFMVKVDDANSLFHKLVLLLGDENHHTPWS